MTLKRAGLGILLVAIGFAGGASFSYYILARPYIWLGAIGRGFAVSQYAIMQSREASYAEARSALKAYVRYLDQAKPGVDPCVAGETPWLDARGIRFDKTLAWVRLATLHENNGNSSAAEAAWREVDALAAQGSWKDRSHEHFRDVVLKLDRGYAAPVPTQPGKRDGA